jgi:transcriptional regulator with XRE-family HTH domain
MEFKERLKSLRIARGLSQVQLAQLAGATQEMISKWENTGTLPSQKNLEKLAGVFGMSIVELRFPPISSLEEGELQALFERIRTLNPVRQLVLSQLVRELAK